MRLGTLCLDQSGLYKYLLKPSFCRILFSICVMPRLHKNVKNVRNESWGFITLKELKKGNEYLTSVGPEQ